MGEISFELTLNTKMGKICKLLTKIVEDNPNLLVDSTEDFFVKAQEALKRQERFQIGSKHLWILRPHGTEFYQLAPKSSISLERLKRILKMWSRCQPTSLMYLIEITEHSKSSSLHLRPLGKVTLLTQQQANELVSEINATNDCHIIISSK